MGFLHVPLSRKHVLRDHHEACTAETSQGSEFALGRLLRCLRGRSERRRCPCCRQCRCGRVTCGHVGWSHVSICVCRRVAAAQCEPIRVVASVGGVVETERSQHRHKDLPSALRSMVGCVRWRIAPSHMYLPAASYLCRYWCDGDSIVTEAL